MSDNIPAEDYEGSLVAGLYRHLAELFGQGSQVFTMEFPPRPLNVKDYAYTIKDHNSAMFKPQAVAEAEFALSDGMLELAPIVSAGTGERISNLFKTAVNNYIPRLNYAARLSDEKGRLKKWLLQHVEGQVLEYSEENDEFTKEAFSGTRLEYSAKLYRTYLRKRAAYNAMVSTARRQAQVQDRADDFADWLSNVAATEEAILSTFYNDAVVRGQLHEVNAAISFLDIPSLGQRINDIKREFRSSARRSVVGGGDVYSVNFSPSDWFESLTKVPSPIDVLSNASYRQTQIDAKVNALENAKRQLASLQSIHVDASTQDQLIAKINELDSKIDTAFNNFRAQFSGRLLTSVRFAYKALAKSAEFVAAYQTGGAMALKAMVLRKVQADAKLTEAKSFEDVEEIVNQTQETFQQATELERLRTQQIELQSKLALAKSSDYRAQLALLENQIERLDKELQVLRSEDALQPSSESRLSTDVLYGISKVNEATLTSEQKTNIEDFKKLHDIFRKSTSRVVSKANLAAEIEKILEDARRELCKLEVGKQDGAPKVLLFASDDESISGLDKDGLTNLKIPNSASGDPSVKPNASSVPTKKELQDRLDVIAKEAADKISVLNESVDVDEEYSSRLISMAKWLGVGQAPDNEKDYYQTVVLTVDATEAQSDTTQTSSAQESREQKDYWFYAKRNFSKSASASSSAQSYSKDTRITLKLRATKVTIERGGWFGVDLFRYTEGLFHVDPGLKSNAGFDLSDFEDEEKWRERHEKGIIRDSRFGHYPMAFVIAKDLEITFSSKTAFSSSSQDTANSTTTSSQDTWFSSKYESSSHESKYTRSINNEKTYFKTLSFPSPVIIGWFQNIVPKDQSVAYGSSAVGASKEEVSKTIQEFLKSVNAE